MSPPRMSRLSALMASRWSRVWIRSRSSSVAATQSMRFSALAMPETSTSDAKRALDSGDSRCCSGWMNSPFRKPPAVPVSCQPNRSCHSQPVAIPGLPWWMSIDNNRLAAAQNGADALWKALSEALRAACRTFAATLAFPAQTARDWRV